MRLWQNIPPAAPENLKAYAAKTVRNIAINRCKANGTLKRGGGELPCIYEELENCIPDRDSAEDAYIRKETLRAVNRFLTSLPQRDRSIFLRRYFFAEKTEDIAKGLGMRDAAVRLVLSRVRKRLKKYLQKEENF